ncbi:prepilin-type N-terminal cleavage/methylation domain-containing protein [Verminephrobacter aporrectodeae subsp. tuberculatae]|uniref:Prepilin-type N-terminal cleavage/methylation domain-containing protein n=1 Tax=Verminephrobacter aporrectodeae subsp. tuberculatae TaxID=1110392 RepID=A0ABT3KPD7_9BURK|nr:PilW family protein [Verminephrobacter aporrectodeae]MCW5320174.1 prepilin-type N-terminal cleavage/methylation domain-containing protein [Verminephrobacter aporrectodeae subsp. tuberculatae]MCW8197862.1 prepilin-type N-terminal cleavage/methylation domain-containing protein [Verminephrobacter aporrectodeae subsp. tuberculatae]
MTLQPTSPPPGHRQAAAGMTLIELLVAMALGLLITLAAAAALLVARQGFTAVDAGSQLQDNGRFLRSIIQRLVVQAGYKDLQFAVDTAQAPGASALLPPDIFGLNNRSRAPGDAWNQGTERTVGQIDYGSDILVLRYQSNSMDVDPTVSDKTMIDCAGVAATTAPTKVDDELLSIFHVRIGRNGEPTLMCSRLGANSTTYDTYPLLSGVENFQLLYGVDGVAPGNTAVPPASTPDSVPERYLRADQLTVANNDKATYANWHRVRSIRVGVVLRGPPGSAIDRSSQTFYPFGISKSSAGGTKGSAFADSTNDPGTAYTPAADGRLRQTVTFTVHLRNPQGEW